MTEMRKRFVAGAVCPSCSKMDKIVTYESEGESFRECVRCGFTEKLSSLLQKAKGTSNTAPSSAIPLDDTAESIVRITSPEKSFDKS